jgi:hypothetical protein
MHIVTGLTDVVTFCATPDELKPENREQITKKIQSQQPIVFGSDVIGDMGAKLHFVGEPVFEEKEDTLIVCTVHTKLTVNKDIAAMAGIPEVMERDFTAYAKCSDTDKDKYDAEFGKRIALNKAKIHAYAYCMRMFVRRVEKVHKRMIAMVGFTKKMETLINGNAKYVFNLCEAKYPDTLHEEDKKPQEVQEEANTAKVVPLTPASAD